MAALGFSRFRWVLGVAVLGLVVWGCAGRVRSHGRSSRLWVVMGSEPTSHDPLAAMDAATDAVLGNVYRTVLAPSGEPEYGVCEGWVNPSPETWELRLRPGLRFHDGAPVLARDVAASIDAARRHRDWPFRSFLRGLREVMPLGGSIVRIRTHGRVGLVPGLRMVPVMPGGRSPSPGDIPVGSGPYRVVEWSGRRVELERWPPDAPGGARRVTIMVTTDSSRQLQLLRTAPAVIGFLVDQDVASVACGGGCRCVPVDTGDEWYLVCNVRPGRPLASRELRRRLAASLDRGAIARVFGADFRPASDVVPPELPGGRRHRLRIEARWAAGPAPRGCTLDMLVLESVGDFEETLIEQLQVAGWDVRVHVTGADGFFAQLGEGRFDIAPLGFAFPSADALELFATAFPQEGLGGGGPNFSGYRSEDLDRAIRAALTALDEASRLRALNRAAAIMVRDLPWIPLVVASRNVVVRGGVTLLRKPSGVLRLLDAECVDVRAPRWGSLAQ